MVRAKFRCVSITESVDDSKHYTFQAVTTGEENKLWSKRTPLGKVEISITIPNAQVFLKDKEYYLDFTACS